MTIEATTKQPITYNELPAKLMIYPAILFMIIGMGFGVFISFNAFIFPDYFSGEYITFGRLRPVHVGHVTLLWLISANIGLFYYFVPRLCGVPLWSNKLAYISIALWWFGLTIGTYSYPWGTNFGWEYAELPTYVSYIPVKLLFTIAFILTSVNLYATIATRRFEKMYVSLWYVMGTLFWTAFTWIVGSYAVYWVPGGISRVNVNFFYVHNLVGLIFTPMGLAIAYYALPKLANVPIYSHRLSMIGFWSISFFLCLDWGPPYYSRPHGSMAANTFYCFFDLAIYSCLDCCDKSFCHIKRQLASIQSQPGHSIFRNGGNFLSSNVHSRASNGFEKCE